MVKGRVEVLDISDVYTLTMATVMSICWQGQRDAGVIILTSCWKFEHDVPDWLVATQTTTTIKYSYNRVL